MGASIHLHVLFLGLLCFGTLRIFCNDVLTNVTGIERERRALLKFKESLTDPFGKLSSWHGQNCCTWSGVICSTKHGLVDALDLSESDGNLLGGEINPSLLQLKHLTYLSLRHNDFRGTLLPEFIGSLHKLNHLDLWGANFGGLLPPSLGDLSELQYLYLAYNNFSGSIPESLGKLSNLGLLVLDDNSWEGVISETHFANLTRLESLSLTSKTLSSFTLNVSTTWIPPFNITSLTLRDCRVGPQFPPWLQTQKYLRDLDLRNTGISDSIPVWFKNFTSLENLDLSYNHIRGKLPFDLLPPPLSSLELSNNCFSGQIPSNISQLFPFLTTLDLSRNLINGKIPTLVLEGINYLNLSGNFINGKIPTLPVGFLEYLDLSRNLLNGAIPSSILNLTHLQFLSLSMNDLSGELPLWNYSDLRYLDIRRNHLTGRIPVEMGNHYALQFLSLKDNDLYGEVPLLQHLNSMITLDLGENNFSGEIPIWMGEGPSSLRILRLRSNSFTGHIPRQLCYLSSLQFIDLGHNKLSGSIPPCFENLSALVRVGGEESEIDMLGDFGPAMTFYLKDMDVSAVKGRELDYSSNLNFLKSIDLSSNNLSGEIPDNLTRLLGLNILNLSMNHLTGRIPQQIGNLKQLECLDLSQNHLSGMIPPSISDLSFLSRLNLSMNNLSGRILWSNQLQTLNDSSIYEGNPQLCGPPLKKQCPGDEITPNIILGNEEGGTDHVSFYIGLGTGFALAFGGVCGSLLLSRSWRRAYFHFFDDMKDRIYVVIAIRIYRLQRALAKTA